MRITFIRLVDKIWFGSVVLCISRAANSDFPHITACYLDLCFNILQKLFSGKYPVIVLLLNARCTWPLGVWYMSDLASIYPAIVCHSSNHNIY